MGTIVKSRVDRAIGRYVRGSRNFQSQLLAVMAKRAYTLEHAISPLVVYLACLRQARLSRNRRDASVFGLASNGYVFIFVTITPDGTLKQSRQFDITGKDMMTVLGCLKYLLVTTSPNLTLEKKHVSQRLIVWVLSACDFHGSCTVLGSLCFSFLLFTQPDFHIILALNLYN